MANEKLDDVNDQRNARIISVILGICTLGIAHGVCALMEWCITPSSGKSAQEKTTKAIAEDKLPTKGLGSTQAKEEKEEDVNDGWDTIPEEVLSSLNSFLPDVQNLPVYPVKVPSPKKDAKPEFRFLRDQNMPQSLMRGEFENGRPFIVAKVSCELTDGNIAKICNGWDEEDVEQVRGNRIKHHYIFLYQEWPRDTKLVSHDAGGRAKFLWQESPFGFAFSPIFFEGALINSTTGAINDREREHAANLGKLLKGEEANITDLKGISWRLFV